MPKGIENTAYYAQTEFDDMDYFDANSIEPAAGKTTYQSGQGDIEEDIITQKLIESLSTLSTLDYGEQ